MLQQTLKIFMAFSLGLTLLFTSGQLLGSQPVHAAQVETASSVAQNIIVDGKRYLGVPYNFGAKTGHTRSFDCSSFTQYMYRINGISIPRTSRAQSHAGKHVARRNLQPGDLVFFYSPVHHVAIYIGQGKIMHTYGKPGVTISNLKSGWWDKHYTTARRVIPRGKLDAVVKRAANFRTSPSLDSHKIRKLKRGEKVKLLNKTHTYWYKVKDRRGRIGYISSLSHYIRLS